MVDTNCDKYLHSWPVDIVGDRIYPEINVEGDKEKGREV